MMTDITKDRQEVDVLLDSVLATQGTGGGAESSTSSSGASTAAAAGGEGAAPVAAPKTRDEVLAALAEDVEGRLAQPFDIEAARYKWVEGRLLRNLLCIEFNFAHCFMGCAGWLPNCRGCHECCF